MIDTAFLNVDMAIQNEQANANVYLGNTECIFRRKAFVRLIHDFQYQIL